MKKLILILLVAAFVLSPFGKSIRSKLPLVWQGFVNSFDTSTKNVKVKSNEGNSYSKGSTQTSSYNQTQVRPLRGAFTQLRQAISSATKQNSAGQVLSQQRAMSARDFNYGNTAALKQQRFENSQAFKQSSGNSASQSLAQSRISMARELSSY